MALPNKDVELSTINRSFNQYKHNAKRKGIKFNLSMARFRVLIKGNCFYCNAEPRYIKNYSTGSKRGAYMNGVDRYVNTRGYSFANTVSCCTSCNYLKGTLNGDEFIAKVKLIAEVIYGRNTAKES